MGSSSVEVPRWLKRMPLAPEFRPTDTEFADPIAYISKIEKEASAFGICKIIPPLPKPSKRYVFHNLNETLSKCPELGKGLGSSSVEGREEPRAVFTTRQQELGQGAKRAKGAVDRENQALGGKKHVWQSGEAYTLEQFESKSKVFLRSVLGMLKEVNPLVIEALFWKAASEKPIYVEYANDVPGSGFAEPEGQFQYFRRRRRKRASYKSYRENIGNSDSMEMETKSKHAKDGATDHDDANPCPERSSSNASMSSPDDTTRPAKKRSEVLGDDMVGTAGWKLSNSPWNLQVIARSPGSLTRFMPDDIPGVTSPMVYIGMLFSWFAWHVEDHELHSLNFLHTGSPKTWYAVPGEHAQTFEEAIRSEVYGGNVDRLAALTSLGEKTTLLSPEAIVSSGIPCCRLVQNPGEFVVTFPRAYHVGFSHGFNCGEAANFGTPQWLEVAKDAAVRRAAMNYLPMLSHQQLMYLLTMSFVSRVPRSLLPGVRCSRLRDRQREDRELSVKKAFLEDVSKESQLLSCLIAKNSAYYAVTWNVDLLPCATRETQLPGTAAANVNLPAQDATHLPSDCSSDGEKRDLVQEMSLYMETLNGLYVEDDDDLSTDFQMDSGSLACVACGILGFPFMCVIQPSKQESLKHPSLVQRPTEDDPGTTISPENCDEGCACLPHLSAPHMNISTPQGWSTSCRFLRPRIFCLEHGTQIEQLLRSKGGANLLVICHSDYQKIKAHISAIAEEISVPCNYHDGSMDIASQEELNLIDLAIDDNIHAECGEDWTSVVGINLRFCVKIRKRSPSQQVQHALALGGLFSEENPRPRSCMKWKSKRSRSRVKLEQSTLIQSSEEIEAKRDKVLPKESTLVCVKEEKKLIQYSRRKFKERVSNVNMRSEACQGKQSMAHQTTPVCGETSSGRQMESCAATSPSGGRTSENNGMLLEVGGKDLSVACSYTELESSDSKEVCAVPRATSSKGDLCSTLTLDGKAHEETQTGDKKMTELHFRNSAISMQSRSLPVSVIGPQRENLADNCPSYDAETHPGGDSVHGMPGNEVPSIAIPTDEDLVSSSSYQMNEPIRSLVAEEDSSLDPKLSALNNRKRKREAEKMSKDSLADSSFIKSPCEGLRPRATKSARSGELHVEEAARETTLVKSKSKSSNLLVPRPTRKEKKNKSYKCDLEGCRMCFRTKTELSLHKRNQCPYEGCRKRFSSHNYAMVHQRVHEDDRPLKCPWEGCSMSFKWAWARTEHLRVHTGEKPYQCKVEGCGVSFRFVSDFSRHRRRTGHHLEAPASP